MKLNTCHPDDVVAPALVAVSGYAAGGLGRPRQPRPARNQLANAAESPPSAWVNSPLYSTPLADTSSRPLAGPSSYGLLSTLKSRPRETLDSPDQLAGPSSYGLLSTLKSRPRETLDLPDQLPSFNDLYGQDASDCGPPRRKRRLKSYFSAPSMFTRPSPIGSRLDLPNGLVNHANNCYLNSILQCLNLTEAFASGILASEDDSNRLLSSVRSVLGALRTGKGSVHPLPVLKALPAQFHVGEQMDASEACISLFDGLGGDKSPLLLQTFAGETEQSVACTSCEHVTTREDIVTDFQLNLTSDSEVSVESLFHNLQKVDTLDGYRCDECRATDTSIKSTSIRSVPSHIFGAIPRYSFDPVTGRLTKLMTRLRLRPTMQLRGRTYELYAVVLHMGTTADSGHYFTIGRNSESPNGQWYEFDDTYVRPIEDPLGSIERLAENHSTTPFCVFYRCSDAPFTA